MKIDKFNCNCVDCPLKHNVRLNWNIDDQVFVEEIVRKSGVKYTDFLYWIFEVIEKAEVVDNE